MTVKIISIKSPNSKSPNPLNPLSRETRLHLSNALKTAIQTPEITSIILYGGSNFSAGADITEFQPQNNNPSAKDAIASSEGVPSLTDLAQQIESSNKPIVAALTGVVLGGGCELALACHFRVALKNCKIGLPEVKIGLIPGAGGTQRLPRLTKDVLWCLDVITSGRMVGMDEAKRKGVVDDVVQGTDILNAAKKWARFGELMGKDLVFRKSSNMRVFAEDDTLGLTRAQYICDQFLIKMPPKERGGESLHAAIAAVRTSFEQTDFEKSMNIESDLFWDLLLNSKQGRGLRYAFFAERAIAKGSSEYLNGPIAQALNRPQNDVYVGVVGAGTMGSGIAINFLRAGYKVILVDNNEKGLERGASIISQIIQQDVKKKRISVERAKSILSHNFFTTVDMSQGDFCKCILVVEAVFENLDIKQAIFRQLDQVILNPQALLLSNTSTLNINSIASALSPKRRAYCAGMHFFSPAHVMKLVEIVVSSDTSPETIALIQYITSKKLKKVGVTVGNCEGFVGNRMLFPYTGEATFVLEEGGATVSEVDNTLTAFGMAIGPMNMGDLAGNDIGYLVRKGKGLTKDPKTGAPGPNRRRGMRYSDLPDDLVVKLGRVGQKAMKGWYDYDMKIGKGRKPIYSKEVEDFIVSYGDKKTKQKYSQTEIIERTLFPLVNEGFKILEENIAAKPSDIDVIYLYGYGWPAFRGGPMYWIDNEVGLGYFLNRLQDMNDKYPGSTYYIPSKLLKKCVALGLTLQQYYEEGMQNTHKQRSKL